MKTASSNRQNRKPSRRVVIDWGSLLSLIGNELDVCIGELRERKRGILQVQKEYFQRHGFDGSIERNIKGLERLASELGGLDHGMGWVASRFEFRAKLFQDFANEAIRKSKERLVTSDLDEE